MFKLLQTKDDLVGFDNFTVLLNTSIHWVVIDDEGRRVPPNTFFAISSDMLPSKIIKNLLTDGLVSIYGKTSTIENAPKTKKSSVESIIAEEVKTEETSIVDNVSPVKELLPKEVVADPEAEDWVSYTDNTNTNSKPEKI